MHDFDFSQFVHALIGTDCSLVRATYYVGAIKTNQTKKSQDLFSNQRRLLNHLKKCNFNYFLGYLLKSGGTFHEKGVDVKIAVDILMSAYENSADKIILVSSDTDFLPAIKVAMSKNKIVEYAGFSHNPSRAMMTNCSTSRLFSKADLLTFFTHLNLKR